MHGDVAQRAALPRQYATEGLRPQTLLFTFLGHHFLDQADRVAVASSTLIDVLVRLGVSVQAARSTLTRMVARDHLVRHRQGRRAYFQISERLQSILSEGGDRLFQPPVRTLPDETWTLLSFSIPEDQRGDRHSLRTALSWTGFGLLRNGLWIAPGRVDVRPLIARLGLHDRIEVFTGTPAPPTDIARVVAEAWDLDAVAEQYSGFIARWTAPGPPVAGPLAQQVRLLTEWQQILVDDPELPTAHLPADWPAMEAYALFRSRLEACDGEARRELADILETIDLEPSAL